MELKLQSMKIKNFKGIKSLKISFSEKETRIAGTNGSGKSSIVDAFTWLLFNKNSNGDAPGTDNFREKPLDDDGNEIHNVDTEVEIKFVADGKPLTMKRRQSENWQKKRGSISATYQGNNSQYWINGVEVKLADFKAEVNKMVSEDIFRLIASLSAFNRMEWKKRREQLLKLSPESVDERLLKSAKYAAIADETSRRCISVDDLRKVLADNRKRLNKELESYPIRIDEATQSIPDINPQRVEDARYFVEDAKQSVKKIEELIEKEKRTSEADKIREQEIALQSGIAEIKASIIEAHARAKRALKDDIQLLSTSARGLMEIYAAKAGMLDKKKNAMIVLQDELKSLREKFMKVKSEPVPEVDGVCPCCGQALPPDQIERAVAALVEKKKAVLDEINAHGKATAAKVAELKAEIEIEEKDAAEAKARLDAVTNDRNLKQAEYDIYPEPDFDTDEIKSLESELQELRSSGIGNDKTVELIARKEELQKQIEEKKALIEHYEFGQQLKERIANLEKEQLDIGEQLTSTETLMMLIDDFVKDRCGALEESVNGCFKRVRWKLFDKQINGAVVDTCVCMIPCESGLVSYESANTASQIGADIEIINTLSDFYGVHLPLFIDNFERCVNIPEVVTQVITLSVSPCELTIDKAG